VTIAHRPPALDADQLQELLDALLYSVSHDLRSPLLTISLSSELLTEHAQAPATPGSSGQTVAVQAMRDGAADLERLLQSVTLLSRARRRTLEPADVSLRMLLGGYLVLSEVPDLGDRRVAVDAIVVRELLDALTADGPAEVRVALDVDSVVLRLHAPNVAASVEGSPLLALAGSLSMYAGTVVEALAVAELLLHRMEASLTTSSGEVTVWLPLSPGTAA
jgi:hypothetical protein